MLSARTQIQLMIVVIRMADHRFDEQQIGAILQKAAEMQSSLAPGADQSGLTLAELQKVASEVGIEPHLVERAAKEVVLGGSQTSAAAGMLDKTIEGELSEEGWEEIVASLRHSVGLPGTSTVQGLTREWSGNWDTGHLTFTATSRNGQTRFRMFLRNDSGVLAGVLGSILGFLAMIIVGAGLGKSGAGALYTTLGVLMVALVVGTGATLLGRRWRKGTAEKYASLFDSIVNNASMQHVPLVPIQSSLETPQAQHLTTD